MLIPCTFKDEVEEANAVIRQLKDSSDFLWCYRYNYESHECGSQISLIWSTLRKKGVPDEAFEIRRKM